MLFILEARTMLIHITLIDLRVRCQKKLQTPRETEVLKLVVEDKEVPYAD
jgi:hypothetical protein